MDEEYEKIEKVVGNQHKYQYITLFISMIIWFATSYITVSVPFFVKRPQAEYFNSTSGQIMKVSKLTYQICDEFEYNITKTYDYSLINQYNINCEKLKVGLIGSTISFAMLVGAIIQAFLVDLIGRQKTLFYALMIHIPFIFSFNFIPTGEHNFYFIYIFCFFIEITGSCSYICAFLYICEMNTFKNRPICSGFIKASISLCGIIHITIYYYFDNHFLNINISVILAIISFFSVMLVFFETPKYFFIKGNFTKFLVSFRNIAKFNNRFLKYDNYLTNKVETLEKIFYYEEIKAIEKRYSSSQDISESLTLNYHNLESDNNKSRSKSFLSTQPVQEESEIRKKLFEVYKVNPNCERESEEDSSDLEVFEKKYQRIDKGKYLYTLFDIFKFKSQRWISLKLIFIWFSISGIYYTYGNVFVYFKGSLQLNGIIFYVIEMIFFIFSGYVVNFKNIGRIKLLVIFNILALVGFIVYMIFTLPGYFRNIVAIFFKISISGIHVILFVYTYEVYPLVLRSKGFTVNIIFGRFGALIFLPLLELAESFLMYIFVVILTICLFVVVTLPETVIKKDNDTLPPEKVDSEVINDSDTIFN